MKADDIQIEDYSHHTPDEMGALFRESRRMFSSDVEKSVAGIITAVASGGDGAIRQYTRRYDGVELTDFSVSSEEINAASQKIDTSFSAAVDIAIERVRRFHEYSAPHDWTYTDEFGDTIGQKCTPVERVGIYIPGGKAAYPSSLIMTAVPALVAGVEEIVIISPPSSFIAPSPLCATIKKLGRVHEVYRIGGVQGIAALAFGTETIRPVDKIVGPGNIHVTLAKKQLFGYVDIDMVAGPSEVLVVTDGSVHPRIVAADLLAQAEHDENARPLCAVTSGETAGEIAEWIVRLAAQSPRREIIEKSIRQNGKIYIVRDVRSALSLANSIAPEHLELQVRNAPAYVKDVVHAGAVFIGSDSAEVFGDYVAGPSHVLPTGGTARFFSPLNVLSFMKFSSTIQMSKKGVAVLGKHARAIAESEGLLEHARSIDERISNRKR